MMSTLALRTATKLCAVGTAAVLLLAGCAAPGSTDEASPKATAVSKADFDKAMSTPTTIEYWSWLPEVQQEVALFEKKYPAITVNLSNVGAGTAQFTKVRTALQAGNAPDVMHIDDQTIASFADDLLDLTPYGAAKYADDYLPATWGQVQSGDRVLGVPIDVAPMGAMYRSDILEKAGVAVPTTYDDFATAAKAVKEKTGAYLTNLASNDAGHFLAILWAAGVKPFGYDGGEKITVALDSDKAKDVIKYWDGLVKDGLVSTDPDFTDAWYRGFATDQYASWFAAPWGPRRLQGTAENTTGLWTLAKMPQYKAGEDASGLFGGSSTAVLKTSKNPIVAAEFARFLSQDPESSNLIRTVQQQTPALKDAINDPGFLATESDFFAGQKVNQLFVDIEKTVDPEYQWLPYMSYVSTSFSDTLGKALTDKTDLEAGLEAWQKAVVDYGTQQGFTVN
jgi:multiple sugar transport system substrate-binding protein